MSQTAKNSIIGMRPTTCGATVCRGAATCWKSCRSSRHRLRPVARIPLPDPSPRKAGRGSTSPLPKGLAVADELLAGQIDAFAVVGDDAADHLRAPAVALQNGQYRVAILLGSKNAKPDAHIVDLMHLRIADVPQSLDQLKYRRRRRQAVDQEPDFGVHTRQVQKPVAGDVDQCSDRWHLLDDVEYLRYVDQGRAQQFLAERNAELGEDMVDRRFTLVEEDAAGERQAITVDAAAFYPDDEIAWHEIAAGDDAVERHYPDCRADEVEAADNVLERGDLAPRD